MDINNQTPEKAHNASETTEGEISEVSPPKKCEGSSSIPIPYLKPKRRGRRGKRRKHRKSSGEPSGVEQRDSHQEKHDDYSWDETDEDDELLHYDDRISMLRPTVVAQAPQNSTSFIIDDHIECKLYKNFEIRSQEEFAQHVATDPSYMNINYVYMSPENYNNVSYYDDGFEQVYRSNRFDELMRMNKNHLIDSLRKVEDQLREINHDLVSENLKSVLQDLQVTLLSEQEKYAELRKENQILRASLKNAGIFDPNEDNETLQFEEMHEHYDEHETESFDEMHEHLEDNEAGSFDEHLEEETEAGSFNERLEEENETGSFDEHLKEENEAGSFDEHLEEESEADSMEEHLKNNKAESSDEVESSDEYLAEEEDEALLVDAHIGGEESEAELCHEQERKETIRAESSDWVMEDEGAQPNQTVMHEFENKSKKVSCVDMHAHSSITQNYDDQTENDEEMDQKENITVSPKRILEYSTDGKDKNDCNTESGEKYITCEICKTEHSEEMHNLCKKDMQNKSMLSDADNKDNCYFRCTVEECKKFEQKQSNCVVHSHVSNKENDRCDKLKSNCSCDSCDTVKDKIVRDSEYHDSCDEQSINNMPEDHKMSTVAV